MSSKCFDRQILIPPPPGNHFRLRELSLVNRQYKDRFNPEFLQEALDKNISKVYKSLLDAYNKDISEKYIEDIKMEVLPYVDEHKSFFNSLRPNELADKVKMDFEYDKLESAQSPSYPSGHTTQAYYCAFILSEKYPELEGQLFLVADMIAQSRIDRGVHFPSDNDGGILLAKKLYDMRKKASNNKVSITQELVSIANELDKRMLFSASDFLDSIIKKSMPLSQKELDQLGEENPNSSFKYIDKDRWSQLRESLVSKKPSRSYIETDTFTYDPELTAYTPGETLSLLDNPKIKNWFSKIEEFKIPDEYKHVILVPCAASKPWGVSCPSSGKYYKAYHDIKRSLNESGAKAYWVTISEPLGIVPEDMWDSFPGYDVPGLFKDPSSRMSGMTTKDWNEMFGEKMSPPFDSSAYSEAIRRLGEVISTFIENNIIEGRRWISFVKGTKGKVTTHTEMISEATSFLKGKGIDWSHDEHTKEMDSPGHPTRSRIYDHIHSILSDKLKTQEQL